MPNQNRTAYFDILRDLATFAVILLHLCAAPWESLSIDSAEWVVFHLADSAVRWSVPLFVMLSGALFLNPDKEILFKKLCRKNILRIAVAFVFWSAVYTLIEWGRGTSLKELPLTFLKGEYHMWFLFLILGLYLLIPILRKLTASKKNTACFLLITGVLFFLIPRAVHLLALFGISVPLQDIILSAMNINVVSFCYLFVFVLGHYLHQYDLSKVWRCVIYIVGMVGFAATVGLTLWHSRAVDSASGSFYTYMSLNVMAMAVALFVFGKYHFRNESLHFRVVSRYSFGIYLSHVLFIDLLSPIGVTPWTLPLISVAVFCLSLGLSALLHRIPVLKKYIV